MIKDLFWPSGAELDRLLYGAHQTREAAQWVFWLALCFVANGVGPWWANLVLPFAYLLFLCTLMTMAFIRETRRFEWTDNSGIYLVPQPALMGRMMIVNARAFPIFAPLAFPFPDFGILGMDWILKVSFGGIALFLFTAQIIRSQSRLWRLSANRSTWLTIISMASSLLPVGMLAVEGYWSRQAADVLRWSLFAQVEFLAGWAVCLFGALSLVLVIWQFVLFHTQGSRKPEGQRRRRLQTRVRGDFVRGLILATVPFACWFGVQHWRQHELRRILYAGDVRGTVELIHHTPHDLKPGVPYRADYYDLKRLVEFHRELMLRPVKLEHFSDLSLRWWRRHIRSRDLVFLLKSSNLEKIDDLDPAEELIVRQILLDHDGRFTKYVESAGLLSQDVVDAIVAKRSVYFVNRPS